MKYSDKIFARLGEKPIKIWNFWENFKIYMQKSQWKIDFLPILSPIFQDLCHFINLCKIPKLGVGGVMLLRAWTGTFDFGEVGGLYKSLVWS